MCRNLRGYLRFRPSKNRKSESLAESDRFHFLPIPLMIKCKLDCQSCKQKPKNKPGIVLGSVGSWASASACDSDNLVFTGS